ncbi:putative PurR-regulated permease PerM [Algoriphagus ratkowskyi]|uniref:AI-2E family transporter n=1 Tax=Algoriphagus ratkowskyi TaxID=57028 RepID=A0A2W7RKC9_9BACT|nr:AI-2E family transporter [Algoriphagus ratkowskyi]PZX61283.1 putative PurR-regulated permease PerM [Algoriphagus ratkowskyi]TXD79397.1 AI-2E family transporter [Algoriphagus ratkowskyi]
MKAKQILFILTLLIVGTYFMLLGTIEAAGFLKPFAVAILLTLICIPLCRKLERWKFSRALAALTSVVISLLLFLSFFVVLSAQVVNISERWPEIKTSIQPKLEEFNKSLAEKTGLDFGEELGEFFPSQDSNSVNQSAKTETAAVANSPNQDASTQGSSTEKIAAKAASEVGSLLKNFFNFISSAVLTLVYLFFLLLYRNKVKLSILKFFNSQNRKEAEDVMNNSIELSLNFIVGRLILIAFLAVIYSIGLSVSGIENAILISVIAAILSLVPFIGNIIGYGLAMVMALFAGAEVGGIIGVSVTFGIAQFVESYILEPYVVGSKVEVNPLVTIVVVILGGSIWGIVGMILSIPITGIAKIIFDATPSLEPLGYALGEEDLEGADEQNFLSKWGQKLWSKVSK